jgi:hypothetical protein
VTRRPVGLGLGPGCLGWAGLGRVTAGRVTVGPAGPAGPGRAWSGRSWAGLTYLWSIGHGSPVSDNPKEALRKHRHDLGHEDHGPKLAEGTTRAIQILLGLWIALTLCLVVYALVDGSRANASQIPAQLSSELPSQIGGRADSPAAR